jgi:hypothetical protein
MPPKKENNGCGCASVPFSLIIVLLGVGYWGFLNLDKLGIKRFLANIQPPTLPNWIPKPSQPRPIAHPPLSKVTPRHHDRFKQLGSKKKLEEFI